MWRAVSAPHGPSDLRSAPQSRSSTLNPNFNETESVLDHARWKRTSKTSKPEASILTRMGRGSQAHIAQKKVETWIKEFLSFRVFEFSSFRVFEFSSF